MKIFSAPGLLAGVLMLVLVAAPALGQPAYGVIPLGTLGGSTTVGSGIHNSGQVTGAPRSPAIRRCAPFFISILL